MGLGLGSGLGLGVGLEDTAPPLIIHCVGTEYSRVRLGEATVHLPHLR